LATSAICYARNLLGGPSAPPITIAVVDHAYGASNNSLTQVLVSNAAGRRYDCVFSTEVFRNGLWRKADVQDLDAAFRIDLAPRSQHVLSVAVPQEGQAWRATLVASPVLGKVETELVWLLRRLQLEYPSGKSFQVKGSEILNRSVEAKLRPI